MRRGLLLAAVACVSCSALIDPDSLVILCEVTPGVTEQDPCQAAGLHCVAGVCKGCEGTREDCNGIDDDCDGEIDEGHDQDNDGLTWCGGGVAEFSDCVPTDPDIHPGRPAAGDDNPAIEEAEEACDGKDNDCDGEVDEAEGCEVMIGCKDSGCPSGLSCDADTDRCIVLRPVGAGCTSDAECDGGFCMDTSDFSSGDVSDTRCATACCSDADCGEGSACEVTASGIRACLPTEIAGRGSVVDDAECESDSDCVSGLCVRGRCGRHCRGEDDCGAEQACVLASAHSGDPQSWLCAAAKGRGDGGEACLSLDPTSCKSGACFDGKCAIPCSRSSECPGEFVCTVEEVSLLLPPTRARVSICGTAEVIEPLCCTSADCGAALCKPKMLESSYAMVCQAN